MRLNEIFSDDFIAKLNGLNDGANLNPEESVDGFIDVEKILKELKFKIRFEDSMSGSGRIDGKSIYIDESEGKPRQRFSMAHELGHAMQNNRSANRKDDSDDYDAEERKNEVFANTFAAQFLMPKKLVTLAVKDVISKNKMDANCLSDGEIDLIINESAEKLQVSRGAMKYRIKNLKIFIPAKGNN